MREKKSFFTENNQLNKGYKSETKLPNKGPLKEAEATANLPEASVLAAYEEMQPGTIARMMEMTAKEQEHRHNIELIHIKMQKTGIRVGRLFAVFAVMAICYTAFAMAVKQLHKEAIIFAAMGFVTVAVSACAGRCKNTACTAEEKTAPQQRRHKPYPQAKQENRAAGSGASVPSNSGYKPNYHRRRKREAKSA